MKKPNAIIAGAAGLTAAAALAITGASLANADPTSTTNAPLAGYSAQQVPGGAQGQTSQGAPGQPGTAQGQSGQQGQGRQGGMSGETPLTGDQLTKATAAAKAKVTDGTVIRAETDAQGNGVYEVHMSRADGTMVTVYLDANFAVTSTEAGPNGGPGGQGGPQGAPGQQGQTGQQGSAQSGTNVDPNSGTAPSTGA